jgi:thioredoxin-dependent peroxiredoxin
MNTVLFKGTAVKIKGNLPAVGAKAPDFKFVQADLSENTLYAVQAQAKVVLMFPSLDTNVCAVETRKFNEKLDSIAGAKTVIITQDLPFAINRFCTTEGIKNLVVGSDFRYHEAGEKFGTLILDGIVAGLHARAVFVLDQDNTVKYVELVSEVSAEPNYDAAVQAVQNLVK